MSQEEVLSFGFEMVTCGILSSNQVEVFLENNVTPKMLIKLAKSGKLEKEPFLISDPSTRRKLVKLAQQQQQIAATSSDNINKPEVSAVAQEGEEEEEEEVAASSSRKSSVTSWIKNQLHIKPKSVPTNQKSSLASRIAKVIAPSQQQQKQQEQTQVVEMTYTNPKPPLHNHPLVRFVTENHRFYCDVCKKAIVIDTYAWGCRKCNYDACADCYKASAGIFFIHPLTLGVQDLLPAPFIELLLRDNVISLEEGNVLLNNRVDYFTLKTYFEISDEQVKDGRDIGIKNVDTIGKLMSWVLTKEQHLEETKDTPTEFARTLLREGVVDQREAENIVHFGITKSILQYYGKDAFEEIGITSSLTQHHIQMWYKNEKPITRRKSIQRRFSATKSALYKRRPAGEVLTPTQFGNILLEEQIISDQKEIDFLVSKNINLRILLGNMKKILDLRSGLSKESRDNLIDYCTKALALLVPTDLAKLLTENHVPLSPFEAMSFEKFQVTYGSLKFYTKQGLHEIGITNLLTQERILNWVSTSRSASVAISNEEEETNEADGDRGQVGGNMSAVGPKLLETLSAFHLAQLMIEKRIMNETEAEVLIKFGCKFPQLKISDREALDDMGITNRFTQDKITLWCRTQNDLLINVLQALYARAWPEALELIRSLNNDVLLQAMLLNENVSLPVREIVEMVIKSPNFTLVDCVNSRRETPLHIAIKAKLDADFIRLIASKCDMFNIKDRDGNTPLIVCSRVNSPVSVVELIIANGGKVDSENDLGFNALETAVQYAADPAILEAIILSGKGIHLSKFPSKEWFPKQTLVWFAVERNNLGLVKILLKHGCDPFFGHPLHLCARRNGNPDIAKILIQHGVDPRGLDEHGFSSLRIVAQNSRNANSKLATVLINAGAYNVLEVDKISLVQVALNNLPRLVNPDTNACIKALKCGRASQTLILFLSRQKGVKVHRIPNELVRQLSGFLA